MRIHAFKWFIAQIVYTDVNFRTLLMKWEWSQLCRHN